MVSLLLCVQFASCKNIRVEAHELDQTDIRNHFLQDSMRRGQLSPSIMTFTIQVTAAQTNASAVLAGYLSDSSSAAQLRDALGNVLSELLSVTNGSAADTSASVAGFATGVFAGGASAATAGTAVCVNVAASAADSTIKQSILSPEPRAKR